jgi:hypothetical protein
VPVQIGQHSTLLADRLRMTQTSSLYRESSHCPTFLYCKTLLMARRLHKSSGVGPMAYTKAGGLGLLLPESTALSKDNMITAHGMNPATHPWTGAVQFVFSVCWSYSSIMLPNRFAVALSVEIGMIAPGS